HILFLGALPQRHCTRRKGCELVTSAHCARSSRPSRLGLESVPERALLAPSRGTRTRRGESTWHCHSVIGVSPPSPFSAPRASRLPGAGRPEHRRAAGTAEETVEAPSPSTAPSSTRRPNSCRSLGPIGP